MIDKFKLGDLVRSISNGLADKNCKNKIGKIISKKGHFNTVEFFEPVKNGHNGWGIGNKEKGIGKNGYCWNLYKDEIELYQPILKIFLKEKKDGSL